MRVLGLASYPVQAAATRYRLEQFVQPLKEYGITLSVRPFLSSKTFHQLYKRNALLSTGVGLMNSAFTRATDLGRLRTTDVVLVQREAAILGPPVFEWIATRLFRRPMVLDLDDATYISYTSPTYGSLGRKLKWFSKTDDLIAWSAIVTCGNRSIAEYVTSKGGDARVIPTVVDTDAFRPLACRHAGPIVLGWIGTHSTFPYLEAIFPALQKLASQREFKLKIVGSGRDRIDLTGVSIENLEWQLDREILDFQSFDIGLYPISSTMYAEKWAAGKSGFKSIQYMAVGIPYVASPVGAVTEMGKEGVTHLHATTIDDWFSALDSLMGDREKREKMGAAGREHVCRHYSVAGQAKKLAEAIREAIAKGKASQ